MLYAAYKPLTIPDLEIHVSHACNLACESCSHFSNDVHKGNLTIEEAEIWMKTWHEKLIPIQFSLVGGEPCLNPQLTEIIKISSKYWKKSQLKIVTNGLLLKHHINLLDIIRDTNTILCISKHSNTNNDYLIKLAAIQKYLEDKKIRLEWRNAYEIWTRRYMGFGSNTRPFNDNNPRQSWLNCWSKSCPQLHENKIYKCPILAYLPLQIKKYKLDTFDKYLNYIPLSPDCSNNELLSFFKKEEETFCGMCPAKLEHFVPKIYRNEINSTS